MAERPSFLDSPARSSAFVTEKPSFLEQESAFQGTAFSGRPSFLDGSGETAVPSGSQERDQFFSGGLVSDIVDALSVSQYALAGTVGGIGPIEGIKQRFDWIDYLEQFDAMNKPIATIGGVEITGAAAFGTLANVIVDPAWLVPGAKVGKAINSVAEAMKVTGHGALAMASNPAIRSFKEAIEAGKANSQMLKVYERLQDEAIIQTANLMEDGVALGKEIARFDSDIQKGISRYMEAGDLMRPRTLREIEEQGLDVDTIKAYGDRAMAVDERLGKELVKAGVMTEQTFKHWKGQHLRRAYLRHENFDQYLKMLRRADPMEASRLESQLKNLGVFAERTSAQRIPRGAIEQRKDLPPEVRMALGEMEEAGVRLIKEAQISAKAVSRTNFLRSVADEFAIDPPISAAAKAGMPNLNAEGLRNLLSSPGTREIGERIVREQEEIGRIYNSYRIMPDTDQWGPLAGKMVPIAIHDQLVKQRYLEAWENSPFGRSMRAGWGAWKAGKTIFNPSTVARNGFSGLLMADWGAGLSPLNVRVYDKAAKELLNKGDIYQEAKQVSTFLADTFKEAEVRDFIQAWTDPNAKTLLRKMQNAYATVAEKAGNFYQFEEQLGKMAIYIFKRERGMSPKEAAQEAEQWIFNYRKVPRWLNTLRSGSLGPLTSPFITYTYKAVPAVTKAALQNPARVSRFFKVGRGIEETTEQPAGEQAALPDWMSTGAWIRLPVWDDDGRQLYFDTTYLIPFGDLAAEVDNLARVSKQDQGFALGMFNAATNVISMPMTDFMQDLARNQSRFSGQPIVAPGSTPSQKQEAVVRYMTDFFLPPLLGGYSYKKISDVMKGKKDWKGRSEELGAVMAAAFAGIKTRPIAIEEERMWRVRELQEEMRALEGNLRKIATDTSASEEEREELWNEGLQVMDEILAEYQMVLKP